MLGPRASVWGLPLAWVEQAGTWGASWPPGLVGWAELCPHPLRALGDTEAGLACMLVAQAGK